MIRMYNRRPRFDDGKYMFDWALQMLAYNDDQMPLPGYGPNPQYTEALYDAPQLSYDAPSQPIRPMGNTNVEYDPNIGPLRSEYYNTQRRTARNRGWNAWSLGQW